MNQPSPLTIIPRAVLERATARILRQEAEAIRARFILAQRAEDAEIHLRTAHWNANRLEAYLSKRAAYIEWCLSHACPRWWVARRREDPITGCLARCPGCWRELSVAEAVLAERPAIQCCSDPACAGKGERVTP